MAEEKETEALICPGCTVVYMVEELPHETWRVRLPEEMSYIDFYTTPQIQAAIRPMCLNSSCNEYLEKTIQVENWPAAKKPGSKPLDV